MANLPFRAQTATGDAFDFSFPLHPETGDAVRVSQMLSLLLEAIQRDLEIVGPASNGDVLQALAMALSVRARMVHAPNAETARLAESLLATALSAAAETDRMGPAAGRA